MQLIPVVLCGGSGSRLWPMSREQHPKPFMRLADGQSLLQKAFLLGASMPHVNEILAVTNRDFLFKIKDDMDEVNQQRLVTSFVIEPIARNTAAAIASAALQIAKTHGNDALMLVLAADHVIGNPAAFKTAVQDAIELAIQGKLVTFGITPDSPNTGYGYIEADGNRVLQFVEKPTLEKAQIYLASGQFLWNSGIFLFSADAILRAMDECCPDILSATSVCFENSTSITGAGRTELELNRSYFSLVPNESIDYAVMEKSNQVAVVACDIDWSDVGSWSALEQFIEPDMHGNRVEGEALFHDASNCYVNSKDRLVGMVGVDNLLIIDTPDALLVVDRSHDQDVKHLYSALKTQDHDVHKLHRTVHRPWGTYTILEENKSFKIKRLVVKPGGCLSLQLHHHRSEHWVVVSGIAKVHNDNEEFFVRVNESTYIKAGCKHRLENPGGLDLIMIEVQTGDYLGEDDIVRFDDVYGRV